MENQEVSQEVSFVHMKDGTLKDYQLLEELEHDYVKQLPQRLLRELAKQEQETLTGYKINRLQHALQSATRAMHDNAGEEWAVATLLHDIGDSLSPRNHDKMAAEILRPYVREEITWVIEHHGIFQTYYYGHHYGWDRNARNQYKASPYYQTCVDFCEQWDQNSFDPNYPMQDLSFFAPMVNRIFTRNTYADVYLQPGIVKGLCA